MYTHNQEIQLRYFRHDRPCSTMSPGDKLSILLLFQTFPTPPHFTSPCLSHPSLNYPSLPHMHADTTYNNMFTWSQSRHPTSSLPSEKTLYCSHVSSISYAAASYSNIPFPLTPPHNPSLPPHTHTCSDMYILTIMTSNFIPSEQTLFPPYFQKKLCGIWLLNHTFPTLPHTPSLPPLAHNPFPPTHVHIHNNTPTCKYRQTRTSTFYSFVYSLILSNRGCTHQKLIDTPWTSCTPTLETYYLTMDVSIPLQRWTHFKCVFMLFLISWA